VVARAGKKGGEISFQQYIEAVEKIQIETFYASAPGKVALSKNSRKAM
jgi:hypothetical protein